MRPDRLKTLVRSEHRASGQFGLESGGAFPCPGNWAQSTQGPAVAVPAHFSPDGVNFFPSLGLHMASRRVFVDVLLLRIVYPYQGLDQLDHALCISNQVSICIIGFESIYELSQETRQVDDLSVGSNSSRPSRDCRRGIWRVPDRPWSHPRVHVR